MDQPPEKTRHLDNLLVIKFGGKTMLSPNHIRNLAKKAAEYHEERPTLIVVSAMGNETNRLIKLADEVSGGDCQTDDLTRIVAFGENLSANLFATALKSLGAEAVAVTPDSDIWPIFGESPDDIKLSREKINQSVNVKIFEDYSKTRALEGVGNLLKNNVIPVVSGFLAKTRDDVLITLGRGGSDTSSFFLGKILGAKDVIIVTDVDGLMKADPGRVQKTSSVSFITVDEIDMVARTGGQVLHPQSLSYKTDNMKARIVKFDDSDYSDSGTEIIGFYKAQLKGIRHKLALITLVGDNFGNQKEFWSDAGLLIGKLDMPLYGISFTDTFVSFYVSDDHSDALYDEFNLFIKEKPYIKNILLRKNVARLNLSSHENVESPALICDICDTLQEKGINIFEIITSQSDISVFVDWSDRVETDRLFKRIATDINLREIIKKNSE